jgi:hypothetical protein
MSLTKITHNYKYDLLTHNLQMFVNNFNPMTQFIAFDQNKYVLILMNNMYYVFIKNKLKKINDLKIKIYFKNKIFWKDINSFDQNNNKIANQIRNQVLFDVNHNNYNKTHLIGIGGEFYIYFCSLQYVNYIGFSNNKNIIDNANINCNYYINNYNNYLVDYNKFKIENYGLHNKNTCDIIVNLSTITESIIKQINNLQFNKLIIITCKPLKLLDKYFTLKKFTTFNNFSNYVSVSLWQMKIK